MVDFDKMKVVVYDFAHENYPVIYGIHDVIPVGIFGGECQIDFREIYDYLKSFSLVEWQEEEILQSSLYKRKNRVIIM